MFRPNYRQLSSHNVASNSSFGTFRPDHLGALKRSVMIAICLLLSCCTPSVTWSLLTSARWCVLICLRAAVHHLQQQMSLRCYKPHRRLRCKPFSLPHSARQTSMVDHTRADVCCAQHATAGRYAANQNADTIKHPASPTNHLMHSAAMCQSAVTTLSQNDKYRDTGSNTGSGQKPLRYRTFW